MDKSINVASINNEKKSSFDKNLAQCFKVSVKLDRLQFNSLNDLRESRKKHFSASATENNPGSALSTINCDPVKTFKIEYMKRTSPRKGNRTNFQNCEKIDLKNFCPVQSCDSLGHLNGLSGRHWSYKNCQQFYKLNDIKIQNTEETEIKSVECEIISHKTTKKYRANIKNKLKDIISVDNENLTRIKGSRSLVKKYTEIIGDFRHLNISCFDLANERISKKRSSTNDKDKNIDKIESPYINDMQISNFEFDLFRNSIIEETKSKDNILMEENGEIFQGNSPKLKTTKKNNKIIKFGDFEIENWFKSQYPDEFWELDEIFICQYCLKYMKSDMILKRHSQKCVWKHPPGREIYRKDVYSFFEVDGEKNKEYCQNLCLIAKLFLCHKTLYFDVEPFLFYVLTYYNSSEGTFEMIGYFSKEKKSIGDYNLSCILTMPHFQNKGYGKLLIDFSYLLSRAEGKVGSPERPLSDLGLISYRSYWIKILLAKLEENMMNPDISIKDLSQETGISMNDIISTLQYTHLIKYWKGKHVIKMDEASGMYKQFKERDNKLKKCSVLDMDEDCLKWTF